MKKAFITSAVTVVVLAVALVIAGFLTPGGRYFEIVKNLEIFATLFKEVNEYYVDDVNPAQLMEKGAESMLKNLDPYTVYISEDKIESFRTLNTGQYAGIGASTVTIDDRIFISMVYKGFSAYEKGLRVGDEIIKIDNTPIAGLSAERLNQMVKGQAKTSIKLSIIPVDANTDDLKEITCVREKVTIPNVPYAGMLNDKVGYIKFTEFTQNGYKNIKKELQKLMKQGAEGLVLDLRGNLGGLLQEAVDISNLFIDSDLEVVHTRGKVNANNFTSKTRYNPLAPKLPLILLVNNRSASASEIVAGTLQDYDRAVLIGQKTYGKGLVQNTRKLPYNSMVKMTIAKYYIPSGRCIQAVDYTHRNPDGSVGKIPDSLKVAFKTKNGRTVYDGGGIDPEIVMDSEKISEFTRQLIVRGYIFRYANVYKQAHDNIPPAREFNLNEEEYAHFSKWLENSEFTFENPLLDDLDNLKKTAINNHASEEFEATLKKIESKLEAPLLELLNKYKHEIEKQLEQEIAGRYYFEPGVVEASLGDDASIQEAIRLLSNRDEYKSLLTGPGK